MKSKKRIKKGIESLQKELKKHREEKLQEAIREDKTERVEYYKREIKRIGDRIEEESKKLLPRKKRLKGD